jgi:hypothetical protein
MPTDHIVALLIAERDKLNRAIEALGAGVISEITSEGKVVEAYVHIAV